jgi:phosphate starvation-inducible PhoH-like protein
MKRNKSSTRRSFKETQGKAILDTPKRISWQQQNGINRFTLTESQDTLRRKILNNDLTFCVGPAGTGKSLSVLYTYVQEYLKDSTKQIIFIRTPVEAGMDRIGFLPDGAEQKLEPHFASAKALLEQLLSKGKVETDLGHRIHFKIPNFALGATFDNSLICIDEAQQLPPLILKLLLERTGINSKVVVLGDNTQLYVDSKGRNALLDAVPRFFVDGPYGWESKYDSIVYHEFEVEDVMRSELVKSVIRAYS